MHLSKEGKEIQLIFNQLKPKAQSYIQQERL